MFEGLVTYSKVKRINRGYVTHYTLKLTLGDQDYKSNVCFGSPAWSIIMLQYNGFFPDMILLTLCRKSFCPYSQFSHVDMPQQRWFRCVQIFPTASRRRISCTAHWISKNGSTGGTKKKKNV